MKYQTPELFIRLTTASKEDYADALHSWEIAVQKLRDRYDALGERLPQSLRVFRERVCLHDGEVLGINHASTSNRRVVAIDVVQDDRVYNLVYQCAAPMHRSVPSESDVFSKSEPVLWLYDEMDVDDADVCRHSIMLSNGEVLELQVDEFRFAIQYLNGRAAATVDNHGQPVAGEKQLRGFTV